MQCSKRSACAVTAVVFAGFAGAGTFDAMLAGPGSDLALNFTGSDASAAGSIAGLRVDLDVRSTHTIDARLSTTGASALLGFGLEALPGSIASVQIIDQVGTDFASNQTPAGTAGRSGEEPALVFDASALGDSMDRAGDSVVVRFALTDTMSANAFLLGLQGGEIRFLGSAANPANTAQIHEVTTRIQRTAPVVAIPAPAAGAVGLAGLAALAARRRR